MDFSRIFSAVELDIQSEFMFNKGNKSAFNFRESSKVATNACNTSEYIFCMLEGDNR